MAVNKVTYGGRTLVDITDSTVTPASLQQGVTAYNAAGIKVTGTLSFPEVLPIANGGTEATTAAGARENLGVYSASEIDAVLRSIGLYASNGDLYILNS